MLTFLFLLAGKHNKWISGSKQQENIFNSFCKLEYFYQITVLMMSIIVILDDDHVNKTKLQFINKSSPLATIIKVESSSWHINKNPVVLPHSQYYSNTIISPLLLLDPSLTRYVSSTPKSPPPSPTSVRLPGDL